MSIFARRDFPPNNINEFISYAKANAQKLNMAHAGVGAISLTCGLLLNSILGIKPAWVPFNGVSPALNALVAGQVDRMCEGGLGQSLAFVQAGVIKAYMIGAEQRSSALPNLPTSQEVGLGKFQVSAWVVLFAPKEIPKSIIDKLADQGRR